jgi:aspartyl protease family protein
MIGWALRRLVLWGGLAFLGLVFVQRDPALLSRIGAAPSAAPAAAANKAAALADANTLVFRADRGGHVRVDADVNGAAVQLLVDTGATMVALTPEDARAAGIGIETLAFDRRVETAAGPQRMAMVTLREIRIGQLSLYDVQGAVMEHLPMSLLGMSFLSRLDSLEMREGRLSISW